MSAAKMSPDPAISIAAERLALGDPARWSAVLAAPVMARPVLIAVGALNLELARAPWASSEPVVAEMRLQWWVDALEAAGTGKPIPHDIGAAVQVALDAGAPVADLVAAAEARRWDCWVESFEDQAAFDAYLGATSGGMVWAAAAGLGAQPEAEAIARDAGWAIGLANLFTAIPELEARGRRPVVDGRETALRDLARDGIARLDRSARALTALRAGAATKAALQAACLHGWQARAVLRRADAEPARIGDGALGTSEFARRFGLLRAAFFGVL